MRITLFFILLLPIFLFSQKSYPEEVSQVLIKAGSNKMELEKAIMHYSEPKDSLKLKAAYFLIANMDIHYSANYFLRDSTGKKVSFTESNYPTFEVAIKTLDSLRQHYGKLEAVPFLYRDIDSITSSYLINNIESAFKEYNKPFKSSLEFQSFCEYILPYRVSIEPLQNWRNVYEQKFAWLNKSTIPKLNVGTIKSLMTDINDWFTCVYNIEKKTEPLPRLGALQLLSRKKGYCEDVANLSVFALRANGIRAAVDIVPYWATSSGSHTLNYAGGEDTNKIKFDVLFKTDSMFELVREPGKVLRLTYSKQKQALPAILDTALIPRCILRSHNIKDVTDEYWKTAKLEATLFPNSSKPKVVYSCVLNYQKWQPVWWSNNIINGKATFENMSIGVVYLPVYYANGKMKPASYPIALNSNAKLQLLKPDTINLRTISINEQEHYLLYQTGKKYKLFYWNGKWKEISEKSAQEKATSLVFDNVPKNALLMLIPEYSQHKERPFIIDDMGIRTWF